MPTDATASQLERVCRGYRRVLHAEVERPESLADAERSRFIGVRDTDDGMVRIEARLRPEEAAVVPQALDVARRRAWGSAVALTTDSSASEISTETSPPARRADQGDPHEALSRADALVAVAESWLSSVAASEDGHDMAGLPVESVVHVDHAALAGNGHGEPDHRHAPDAAASAAHATLIDGTRLALATARRLAVTRASCLSTPIAKPLAQRVSRRAARAASRPGCAARFACATTAAASTARQPRGHCARWYAAFPPS